MFKKLTILITAMFAAATMWGQTEMYNQRQLLEEYFRFLLHVENSYVDTVNMKQLIVNNVKETLKQLDPHSAYLSEQELKQSQEHLNGEFEGIGVQYQMTNDTLYVIQTISGCPAERAGMRPGDKIISVGDSTIAGVKITNTRIQKLLRGPRGTLVTVGVVRNGVAEPLTFTLKRDKIPVLSVDASFMAQPQIGYIKINSFGAKTYEEFMEAWTALKKQKATKLIIDLRSNGGGYLTAAHQIANEFLRLGDLITYTEGIHQRRQVLVADGKGSLKDVPLVILVDEYSASAAEIVSGAIQDWDRGTIIGRRTFGKGLVQRQFPAPAEGAYRLTVSRYYTPAGRCIQKPYKGVDYRDDINQRYKHGEMTNADSIHFADSLKYYTLREHRTVYGGGGIMPDIFIPADTTRYTPYENRITAQGIILDVSAQLTDSLRADITRKFKTPQAFAQNFSVPEHALDKVDQLAKEKDLEPKDDEERTKARKGIALQIKALIARNIWNYNGYFYIVNSESDTYKKALEVLQDK